MHARFKHIGLIVLFALSLVLLTNCHSSRKAATGDRYSKGLVEDFDKFYNQFHSDSLFQISRTKHPLAGKLIDNNEEKEWTKESLPLMKIRIYDVDTTQYKTAFQKTETTFTQKVWIEDSSFNSECRFELIKNRWYLVYVLDGNF